MIPTPHKKAKIVGLTVQIVQDYDPDSVLSIEFKSLGDGYFPVIDTAHCTDPDDTKHTAGRLSIDSDALSQLAEWCAKTCRELDQINGEGRYQ